MCFSLNNESPCFLIMLNLNSNSYTSNISTNRPNQQFQSSRSSKLSNSRSNLIVWIMDSTLYQQPLQQNGQTFSTILHQQLDSSSKLQQIYSTVTLLLNDKFVTCCHSTRSKPLFNKIFNNQYSTKHYNHFSTNPFPTT